MSFRISQKEKGTKVILPPILQPLQPVPATGPIELSLQPTTGPIFTPISIIYDGGWKIANTSHMISTIKFTP